MRANIRSDRSESLVARFINCGNCGINMAKRKSKKKTAEKTDPITTPVHWKAGEIIKKSAIVKLFPKDIIVQPLWGGREGQLKNLLTDKEYEVRLARVNKDKSWRSYSLRSETMSFGFSEGTLEKFHRFMKPLVRFADVPKGEKGRVKKEEAEKPKKPKKTKSKSKKTSRPKRTT
jgi:hypothetical protein